MQEGFGDIWLYATEHRVDALCVNTNMTVADGKLIMGGGQARQARTRFPDLPKFWGQMYSDSLRQGREHAEIVIAVSNRPDGDYHLVSFPTKYHPSEDSDLKLIERSARELLDTTNLRDWHNVVLGRPGCGLGGLDWEMVKPVIEPFLDDRFTVLGYDKERL